MRLVGLLCSVAVFLFAICEQAAACDPVADPEHPFYSFEFDSTAGLMEEQVGIMPSRKLEVERRREEWVAAWRAQDVSQRAPIVELVKPTSFRRMNFEMPADLADDDVLRLSWRDIQRAGVGAWDFRVLRTYAGEGRRSFRFAGSPSDGEFVPSPGGQSEGWDFDPACIKFSSFQPDHYYLFEWSAAGRVVGVSSFDRESATRVFGSDALRNGR